jgi:hypothetical protein
MRRRPRQSPVSRCDAPGCNEPIKRGMLMCRAHWFRLPRELRLAISTTWAARRTAGMAPWSANVLAARAFLANNSPAAMAARITGDRA